MIEEIQGIPAHPLVVHAAVVFVPLLVLGALVYGLVPRLRRRIGWAVALLAVVAPIAAGLATTTGEALQQDLVERGYPAQILDQVAEHQRYGDLTFWFSLGLALATGLLIFLTSARGRATKAPGWLTIALVVVVVALAGMTAVYTYLAGDSGAQAVWGNF
ncbi:hypothetical protein O7632_29040 [Solwaraspora sp. WMMD406]|uniref:DUF2231 domain-containing protein n=1 Tax=Solwaraspora sp. WMMD406 TaxID=3016095 RepID=UPI00241796EC|nr:DUF2231 domain-containing protein [Solwaraspora sp. WMMD406]MDG4768106.1 hypothetical protein [Solwaraspora sp. WMMD406]